jgi:hypothetical protein
MDRAPFAETLALEALAWLAAQEDLLELFLGATGAAREDLRTGIEEPEFLAAVLDFLLTKDAWVLEFAAARGYRPEDVPRARHALPGGALPDWT